MSREVAVDEGGYVPRMVGLMCRRVDMRERGQQEGQHEREGRNNRGGRTHDVSIARASKMVNLLCVWTQGSYMEELAANCRSSNYAGILRLCGLIAPNGERIQPQMGWL